MPHELLQLRPQAINKTARGWRWSEQLQLFLGVEDQKLQFFTPEGERVPAPAEAAIAERDRAEAAYRQLRQAEANARAAQFQAEQERLRAEHAETREAAERERAEQLLSQLQALSIQPELDTDAD